eukprot:Selendium_serpulae@DN1766_c0_g1_i1.p1
MSGAAGNTNNTPNAVYGTYDSTPSPPAPLQGYTAEQLAAFGLPQPSGIPGVNVSGGTYALSAFGGATPAYNAAQLAILYSGYTAPAAAQFQAAREEPEDNEENEIPVCHLHTKPVLTCKTCRKYKSSVHHFARRATAAAQQAKPQEERKNVVEMTNSTSYNVNNLLRENILNSEYFKSLYPMKTFEEVVDEIYQYAKDAEPYCAGNNRAPSTLFCCLYKLMMMRLTERQMAALLNHEDSPYIRCAGFLYLRYTCPPEKLWKWYEPHFLDDEIFTPGAEKQNKATTTIGEYIEALVTEDKYFNTVLPRLPVRIKTEYGTQLMAMNEHRLRKQENKADIDLFEKGTPCLACSNGDWLESEIIDTVERHKGKASAIVQMEEAEEIDLGLVILRDPEKESD